MVAFKDLTGKRYGELTVLRRAPRGTPKQQAEEQRKKRLLLRENDLETV